MKKALFEAHKLEKGFCMIYDVTQKRSAPYLNRGRFDFCRQSVAVAREYSS